MPVLLQPLDIPPCTVVVMPEEIDISNSSQLFADARQIVGERAGRIDALVMDFTPTSFIDSQAARLVSATRECAAKSGADLRLAVDDAFVDRVLAMTNTRRDVPVFASLAEALMGRPWEAAC
ncbi:STAS domain-containing protein [Streptomyces sp. NPDC055287]